MKWLVALLVVLGAAFMLVWLQTQQGAAPPSPTYGPPPARPAEVPREAPEMPAQRSPAPSEPAPAPAQASAPAPADADAGEIPVFEVETQEAYYAMLAELGLPDAQQALADWSRERGYLTMDSTGQVLQDQPYEQYDELTLEALSAEGNLHATQELAARYQRDRPAEAVELYRRAAAQGSLYAMDELARLYRFAGSETAKRSRAFEKARPQLEALSAGAGDPATAAYAWLAAAERASGDPTRTAPQARQIARDLTPEQIQEACAMASGLLEGLDTMRGNAGTGSGEITPPPVIVAPGQLTEGTECFDEQAQQERLAGCREARFTSGSMTNTVYVCDHD